MKTIHFPTNTDELSSTITEMRNYKDEGNLDFKKKEWHLSLVAYENGVNAANKYYFENSEDNKKYLDDDVKDTILEDFCNVFVALYSNKAQAEIGLERFACAIISCDTIIDEFNMKKSLYNNLSNFGPLQKAYLRKAHCLFVLGKISESRKILLSCQTISKEINLSTTFLRNIRDRADICKKTLRSLKFAEAIAHEATELALSSKSNLEYFAMENRDSLNSIVTGGTNGEMINLNIGELSSDNIKSDFLDQVLNFDLKNEANPDDFKLLGPSDLFNLMRKCLNIFSSEKNIEFLNFSPSEELIICGDVHGQYHDLCEIFSKGGLPCKNRTYLFNGDFVDRGSYSVEVITLLLLFKCANPKNFYMTRGNHEAHGLNLMYGFQGEVIAKYGNVIGNKLYKGFTELFCSMPLGFICDGDLFVCHGGLFSRDDVTISEINDSVNRFGQPPETGIFSEILWSDPRPEPGRGPSDRGVGLSFGPDVTRKFLEMNRLKMVIRSHQMMENGYEVMHEGKLVTIFSAPNYCDMMGNKGAFIRCTGLGAKQDGDDDWAIIDNQEAKSIWSVDDPPSCKMEYVQFNAVKHPSVRGKSMRFANRALSGGF